MAKFQPTMTTRNTHKLKESHQQMQHYFEIKLITYFLDTCKRNLFVSHKLRPFKHYILSEHIQNVRILKGLPWLIHTNYVEEKQTGLLSYKQFKLHELTSWIHTILLRKGRQEKKVTRPTL